MAKIDSLLFENLPMKKTQKAEKKQEEKEFAISSSIGVQKLIFIALVVVGLIAILILGKVAMTKLSTDPAGKCSKFIGKEKEDCIDNLLAIKYIESLNLKKCSKLKTDALRQICVARINEKIAALQQEILNEALTKRDVSVCKGSPNRKACEDAFNLAGASVSENIEDCDKINDKSTSTNCKDNLLISQALTGKDTCSELSNQAAKEDCEYTQVINEANSKQDAGLCDKLSAEERKAQCKDSFYVAQTFSKDDASFCEKITNEGTKNNCLTNYYINKALISGDKSYCEKIGDEEQKNACLQS